MVPIAQSTSIVIVFKMFATGTSTEATGKTVAITISKAGAAFGNPNAGATNATEISSGWYKVTLDTTDTGTLGLLSIRGAATGCDDYGDRFFVCVVPANVTQFGGSAGTFAAGIPEVKVASIADGAITSAKFTVSAITGVATGILEMLAQLHRRFFKRTTKSATEIKTYADDGTSVLTTQPYTSSGSNDEVGGAA